MSPTPRLLVDCRCRLGEGPFWHPQRQTLFWFDILGQSLFCATAAGAVTGTWHFAESVAAAAVVDRDTLALATETGLKRFDLLTGALEPVVAIEADDPLTRANDSRVDRAGGFWIGTMRKAEDAPAGAVYRYRAGRLDRLLTGISIPNAICFSPDGRTAYFSDTPTQRILKCPTDPETGLPVGAWDLFAEIEDGYPDGAVTDSEGYLWNARWGAGRVVRHAPNGSVDRIVPLPVTQVTCPAFGGEGYRTLFLTTASKSLTPEQQAAEPHAGSVFAMEVEVPGLPEPPVML